MSYTDKYIVESYYGLIKGLSTFNKSVLINNLSESLKEEDFMKEEKFYQSFGALTSDKSIKEIMKDIKSNRKFRAKQIIYNED
jgi:uncharacterized protein YjfI (DUF2170 family)